MPLLHQQTTGVMTLVLLNSPSPQNGGFERPHDDGFARVANPLNWEPPSDSVGGLGSSDRFMNVCLLMRRTDLEGSEDLNIIEDIEDD